MTLLIFNILDKFRNFLHQHLQQLVFLKPPQDVLRRAIAHQTHSTIRARMVYRHQFQIAF